MFLKFETTYAEYRNGPVNAKICVHKTDVKNSNVLYYLHGAGGVHSGGKWSGYPDTYVNAEIKSCPFDETTTTFQNMAAVLGKDHPKYVISISFSAFWVLSPFKEGDKQRYETCHYFKDIMNHIEGKLPEKINDRYVIGHSMGGLNSFILTTSDITKNLFKKAIHCNPMFPLSFLSMSPADWAIINAARNGSAWLAELNLSEREFYHFWPWHMEGQKRFMANDIPRLFCFAIQDVYMFYQRGFNLAWLNEQWCEVEPFKSMCKQKLEIDFIPGQHSQFNFVKAAKFLK